MPALSPKHSKRKLIIALLAIGFSVIWALIGILSILNIIQSTWSSLASVIFTFLGIVVALSQWLFPFTPDSATDNNLPLRNEVPGSQNTSPQFSSQKDPEAKLRLVDIFIDENPSRYDRDLLRLEVKLRNVGTQVAFLKQAEFHILNIVRFYGEISMEICHSGPVPITANYDVALPDPWYWTPSENLRLVKISQALAPNEVDRFTFTLAKGHPPIEIFPKNDWYLIKLTLVYNETNQTIEPDPILFSIPPLREKSANSSLWRAIFLPESIGESERLRLKENLEEAQKLALIKAIRSPSVEFVLQQLSSSKKINLPS